MMIEDIMFGKIMDKLREIHEDMPDMKFGNVIQGAVDEFRRKNNSDLFGVSSKMFFNALQGFHENHKRKRGIKSEQ